MSTTIGVRVSDGEKARLEEAARVGAVPGDRGGVSAWMRRLALTEAARLLTAKKGRK